MIKEAENNALQLAKRVFEHFTNDALPIAREIIAIELEMGQTPLNGKLVNAVTNHIPQGTGCKFFSCYLCFEKRIHSYS
jgi:hypothetical protein